MARGRVLAWDGDLDAARDDRDREALAREEAAGRHVGGGDLLRAARVHRAVVPDPPAALGYLTRANAYADTLDVSLPTVFRYLGDLVEAAVLAGDLDLAETHPGRAAGVARRADPAAMDPRGVGARARAPRGRARRARRSGRVVRPEPRRPRHHADAVRAWPNAPRAWPGPAPGGPSSAGAGRPRSWRPTIFDGLGREGLGRAGPGRARPDRRADVVALGADAARSDPSRISPPPADRIARSPISSSCRCGPWRATWRRSIASSACDRGSSWRRRWPGQAEGPASAS